MAISVGSPQHKLELDSTISLTLSFTLSCHTSLAFLKAAKWKVRAFEINNFNHRVACFSPSSLFAFQVFGE